MFSWRADHGPATEEPGSARHQVARFRQGGRRPGGGHTLPKVYPGVIAP